MNAGIAATRAQALISACKAYRAQRGEFPDRLEDLVPGFIPAVPRANYTLWGAFRYWNGSQTKEPDHVLTYVVFPPFGRRLYHFEEDRWSSLD